jgi:hypothetical protein
LSFTAASKIVTAWRVLYSFDMKMGYPIPPLVNHDFHNTFPDSNGLGEIHCLAQGAWCQRSDGDAQ